MDISENITLLIQLQKLDAKIYGFNRRKKELPLLVKALEEEHKHKAEAVKSEEDDLKSIQIRQKDKENELAAKEELIRKCQSQLYQLKTNKEYSAMQHEIEGHKADKSAMEDEIIAMLDQVDAKKRELEKAKAALKEEENRINQKKQEINAELNDIEQKLAQLNAQRQEEAAKVDKNMLAKYERILKGKDGLALVPVREDSCGGCHLNLPPQVINEIRMEKGLVFCESCARILYIEE